MKFEEQLDKFSQDNIAVLVDDSAGISKSVLFSCASKCHQQILNQILSISASQVYVTLEPARVDAFELEPMLRSSADGRQNPSLNMLQSVEAREGIHTGISIADRTKTISMLATEDPNPKMLVKPGHVFPVQISEGGSLVRASLMEAASDICFLTSGSRVAVVVDLLDSQGNYPDSQQVLAIASQANIAVFNLSQLIVHRLNTTALVEKISEADLPLGSGTVFRISAYKSKLDAAEHVALSLGHPFNDANVYTRVQKENLFTDLFNAQSDSILQKSINLIEKQGRGLIVYLRGSQKEAFKLKKDELHKSSLFRDYGIGAQIVKDCGAKKLSLLSSSVSIPEGLDNFGLHIQEVINLNK